MNPQASKRPTYSIPKGIAISVSTIPFAQIVIANAMLAKPVPATPLPKK